LGYGYGGRALKAHPNWHRLGLPAPLSPAVGDRGETLYLGKWPLR
jgi:hypothetical protein